MRRPAVPVLAIPLVLLAGCSAGTTAADGGAKLPAASSGAVPVGTVPSGAVSSGAVPSASGPVDCPAPGRTTLTWPAGVPKDLPKPPGATPGSTKVAADGLVQVRFTTDQSVRQGVLHLVNTLQPAGFTLARGDAEAGEADAPFSRGPLRGIFKMVAQGRCRTQWLLAVAPGTGSSVPVLPPPTVGPSPSPLPFG